MQVWLPKGFEFLSGFPDRIRRKQNILIFQAFFDESGTKGQDVYMTMVGLFGRAEVFAEVADEWDRTLRAKHPGRIRYFKMSEACNLSGEFQHWDSKQRDAKVRQMAQVIDRDDLLEIGAAVHLDAFERILSPWKKKVPGKHAMSHPWVMLFTYVMPASVKAAVTAGSNRPMELVFDEQDTYRKTIMETYPEMRAEEPDPQFQSVMPIQPWFRDDKDFVVLQAADLLAGETRMLGSDSEGPPFVGTLCPRLQAQGRFRLIGEQDMIEMDQWHKGLRGG